MKKITLILAIFAVLLLTVSAGTEREYNAAEGMKAPYFEVVGNDGETISLSDMDGRFVIVNFWASDDAGSRIAANCYSSYVESVGEERIGLVSVNFDWNERLFREIVRRDRLNEDSQFNVESPIASDIIRKFDMADGLKSFLIDPQGRIVAVNPTTETIEMLTAV